MFNYRAARTIYRNVAATTGQSRAIDAGYALMSAAVDLLADICQPKVKGYNAEARQELRRCSWHFMLVGGEPDASLQPWAVQVLQGAALGAAKSLVAVLGLEGAAEVSAQIAGAGAGASAPAPAPALSLVDGDDEDSDGEDEDEDEDDGLDGDEDEDEDDDGDGDDDSDGEDDDEDDNL